MRSAIALLILCVFLCHSVKAGDDECMDQINELKKTLNKMIDDGTIPECAKEYDMAKFKCTAGEDPEKDMKTAEEFRDWFKGLPEEKQKDAMECSIEVKKAVQKEMGKELSEDCEKKMKEMQEKMMGSKEK